MVMTSKKQPLMCWFGGRKAQNSLYTSISVYIPLYDTMYHKRGLLNVMNTKLLPEVGLQLATARKLKFPKDDMKAFAIRVGVARSTYQKMEKGDLSVAMGLYYSAARVLGLENAFYDLFTLPRREELTDD